MDREQAIFVCSHVFERSVRVVVAACLLRHRTVEARRVLQELASGKGFVAFCAEEALKRWEEGTWQLDPA